MDQKTFSVVAGVIFALVALLHLLRIYMGWPIVIGSWTAPMWVSWIGLVVGGVGAVLFIESMPGAEVRNALADRDDRT